MASQPEARRLVEASLGVTAYAAPTTPIKVQLTTAAGTSTAPGTEVTGGSYAAQSAGFGAANTSGVSATTATVSFTGMPAVTVTGINLVDSAATPRFLGYANLNGGNKSVNAGDTVSFATGQITYGITPAP